MSRYAVYLFGKFHATCDGQILQGMDGGKVQELTSYLLLNRDSAYDRASLAALLWEDNIGQSLEYLHEALWQAERAIQTHNSHLVPLLLISPECIQINNEIELWLDAEEFERAFALLKNVEVNRVPDDVADALRAAVALYNGGLLEGCHAPWCLYERERLQNMYLVMLDTLMDYCEANHEYELGLVYGAILLQYDPTNEHTHAAMMWLYCQIGDLVSAARQYHRCTTTLMEELGAGPSSYTRTLYAQICGGLLKGQLVTAEDRSLDTESNSLSVLSREIRGLQRLLVDFQRQILKNLRAIDRIFNGRS